MIVANFFAETINFLIIQKKSKCSVLKKNYCFMYFKPHILTIHAHNYLYLNQ
jgi:hypothetical protein